MRLRALIPLLTLLFSTLVFGQTTSVTLQVTDTDGQSWNNGTWRAALVTSLGTQPFGQPFNYTVAFGSGTVPNQVQSGSLSNSGGASLTLSQNAAIVPIGSLWKLTACPQATSPCFTIFATIAGATQTVTVTPAAIRVPIGTNILNLLYADAEFPNPGPGSIYYNITSAVTRQYVNGVWTTIGGNGALILTNSPNCTTANELVELDKTNLDPTGQATAMTAIASSQHAFGVVVAGAGCSGTAQIATLQKASCITDDQSTVGDWVAASASNPGECTDYGAAKNTANATIGQVVQANAGPGTLSSILIGTPDQLSGANNNGNVQPAPQFRIGVYTQAGTTNTIGGDGACFTDLNGNLKCTTLATVGLGAGTVTIGNGAAPSTPATGNSVVSTNTANGMLTCLNSNNVAGNPAADDCLHTDIDVRLGYGGSGGVDCSGNTDSTAILQAMINNAPDFSQFHFPANCKILVSTTAGSPKAITLQSRIGLEFWFEGRNSNSCDTGAVGPGGARIIDNSTYVSGASVFYINQSQRLVFHNVVIFTSSGAVDQFFDIDQTTSPPITTVNKWENTCLANQNSTRNTNFKGWRFSNTSTSNVERQHIIDAYVECSTSAPTSASSNGYGIWFGNNTNQKNEIVNDLTSNNCSADVNVQFGSNYTFTGWMMSNSWTNFIDNGFNTMLSGMRSENAQHPITVLQSTNAPHIYFHNDFSGLGATGPIDCSSAGCGNLLAFGNEMDSQQDMINPATLGASTNCFFFANRNFNFNQYDCGSGAVNIPTGNLSQFPIIVDNYVTNTFGEFYTSPTKGTAPNPIQASPAVIYEALWNGVTATQEDWVTGVNVSNSNTDSTFLFGQMAGFGCCVGTGFGTMENNISTMTHWMGFNGNFSGLNLAPCQVPAIKTASNFGTAGSSTYTYVVVAHCGNGTTSASGSGGISNGNTALSSSNGVIIIIWPSAGAVYYDVYRTVCGGGSAPCGTGNATGKLGSVLATIAVASYANNNGGVKYVDFGQNGDATTAPTTNTTGNLNVNGNILFAPSAPVIASGFGTSPSIVHSNGTAAFQINVGTGGTATTGVITMPTATNGWACQVADMTTPAKTTTETTYTTTSITLTASAAWAASDNLLVNCGGF